MIRAIALLGDRQRPPKERLGLAEAVSRLQHSAEVDEIRRNRGMVRTKALLEDRQRPPIPRLGLIEPVGGLCG
jgi:hypothetical protein